MKKIDLVDVPINDSIHNKIFFLDSKREFLFSCENLEVKQQEIDILKRWGIKFLYYSEGKRKEVISVSTSIDNNNFISALSISRPEFNSLLEDCFKVFDKTVNSLHIFYTLLKNKTIKDISFVKEMYIDLIEIFKKYESNIIFSAIRYDILLKEFTYLKATLFSTIYSIYLGISYKLSDEKLLNLFIASIIADVGKLKYNEDIFEKGTVSEISNLENIIFRDHCKESFIYLKKNFDFFSNDILRIVFLHHFKVGLDNKTLIKEDMKIPLESNIINICQHFFIFLFLNPNIGFSQITEYFRKKDEFELDLFDKFISFFGEKMGIGTFLELSNGDICITFSGVTKNKDFLLLNLSRSNEKNDIFKASTLKNKKLSIKFLKNQKEYLKKIFSFKKTYNQGDYY